MLELQPGQSFGAYTIINQIAATDGVSTFKAYDAAHARDVTLKLCASAPANFAQTTSALRGLTHPHILPVYDAGVQDGVPYLATRDTSDLHPLRERIADGSLDLAEITRIVTQLADALSAAHARGIAHGALTPDSVLLDASSNVLLADLGLSTFAPRGSTTYTSPEQSRGDTPDPRADLYALGAILATLVTGGEFDAATTALPDALKRLGASLPSNRQSEFALAAERVIRRALASNRDERFATAHDLIAAWQSATALKPAVTTPPPPITTTRITPTIAQRAALGSVVGVTQAAAAQRAEAARRDAIRSVLRLTRVIAARRERLAKARLASEVAAVRAKVADAAPTVQQVQTWAQPPSTLVRRAPTIATVIVVGTLLLCIGVPGLCFGIVLLLSDATATPTPIVQAVATSGAPTRVAIATRATLTAPTRIATSAPTRAPLDTTLVFSDTFSADDCHLPDGDNDKRTFRCANGEYTMLSKNSSARWAYYDDEYDDALIEVDARVVKAAPSLEYGLLWRVSSDGESLYGMTLKPNGQTAVFRYQDTKFNYFIAGLSLSSVSSRASNRLKVIVQQQQMELFVNDASFLSITDAALARGAVGFFIKSSDASAQVAFSNLRVWQINR